MPDPALVDKYERASYEHSRSVRALVPLLVSMALESVGEVLPQAHHLEVHGEINEDWIPILRIRRVLDSNGGALFIADAGHGDRTIEDRIDMVNVEYLDPLLDLTGDDYMGTKTIGIATEGATALLP